MTIVEAGARRDMGQLDAALRTLEQAPLTSKSREPWVVRLRYAYADTLEAAGRESDALAWFHRTQAIDADELTDAAERAEALEKRAQRGLALSGRSRLTTDGAPASWTPHWSAVAVGHPDPVDRDRPGLVAGHLEHDLVARLHRGALGPDQLVAERLRAGGHPHRAALAQARA